ncbi:MAG: HAD-IIIA family hydrolase, partial [Ectothiorhodospiraceae bacterium]|nr:HAD-IIIA family hydrolase [Ectothiorhodospiraceae bacterium]
SGVARGYFTAQTLAAIHQKMIQQLAQCGGHIDGIFYCPHGPDDHCLCRKPNEGMYRQALQHFNIFSHQALVVGDSLRDLQAAKKISCNALLVKTGKGQQTLLDDPHLNAVAYSDLDAVATRLING